MREKSYRVLIGRRVGLSGPEVTVDVYRAEDGAPVYRGSAETLAEALWDCRLMGFVAPGLPVTLPRRMGV